MCRIPVYLRNFRNVSQGFTFQFVLDFYLYKRLTHHVMAIVLSCTFILRILHISAGKIRDVYPSKIGWSFCHLCLLTLSAVVTKQSKIDLLYPIILFIKFTLIFEIDLKNELG